MFTQSASNAPLPAGPRTSALLLLVTTDFVHLSASNTQTPALARGAVNGDGDGFDYVVLDRHRNFLHRRSYAAITSVLAGPHGDSGFGRSEAVREAQLRGASL